MNIFKLTFCAFPFFLCSSPLLAEHNVLTPEETSSGYKQLYNGKDLTGFRSWDNLIPSPTWESIPETTWQVLNIKTGQGNTGSLISMDTIFMNFDLKVEWAVTVAGNSGIFIRYMTTPSSGQKNSWGGAYGPEAQVVDTNSSDGNTQLHRAGDLYDLMPVIDSQRKWNFNGAIVNGKPLYRYNQFRIIAFGNHVAHYGNGHKLLEYLAHSKAWNDAYALSKYKAEPLYGDAHPGAIYLQNHSETGIHFRDLRIKNLTANAQFNPWALGSPYLKNPADTTSGLKDDLTFADNLTFVVTHLEKRNSTNSKSQAAKIKWNGFEKLFGETNHFRGDGKTVLIGK